MLAEFNIGAQDIDSLIWVIHHILRPDPGNGHIANALVDDIRRFLGVTAFIFIIMGTKPVVRRGGETIRRHCPNCGDWRNFQETTWQNFFSLFFVPLFPVSAPRKASTCVTCGLPLSRETAAGPEPVREERPSLTGEALVVQCPRCDGRMRVPLRERGFTAVCPHCTLEFKVKGQREGVPEALTKE